MNRIDILTPDSCLAAGMFPIVAAQEHSGNLKTDGVCNVAVLQDLSTATRSQRIRQTITAPDQEGLALALTELLSLAFADDVTFAMAFPDEALRISTIGGHALPGFYYTDDGKWRKVTPGRATPQQQRDYIRRHLMLSAAKRVARTFCRDDINRIAAQQPDRLHGVQCLKQVAADICRAFDPGFEYDTIPAYTS